MSSYINPAPGTTSQVVLKLELAGTSGYTTALTVPGLQDITVNAANDIFSWSQLDTTAKLQIATTSTNSLSMNLVVDDASFFGTTLASIQTDTVAAQGILGLSRNKTKIKFSLKMVENGATDRYLQGIGYITGLAPKVSADQPVWVSPITITVSGEYTVTATE
jgi:hypothetical protein